MTARSMLTRRHWLHEATVLAGGALGGACIARAQAGKPLTPITLSYGWVPMAAGNSPTTQYMIGKKLFEKHAAQFGYDLTVDYRAYPAAAPQVEAMAKNELDMAMWGNTPTLRALVAGQPFSLVSVAEGRLRFLLCTRKDSPIRNVQDLKGKTVGTLMGADPYNVFTQILRYELGNPDPAAHDIRMVHLATLPEAAQVPSGVDATLAIYPAFLRAQGAGTVAIMNSYGYTEAHYDGPAGKGAGLLLPSVKHSPFYPDGYYLHRSFRVVRNKIVEEHPNLVLAFLLAQQEAVSVLSEADPAAVSQLVKSYWGLAPADGAKVVRDEVVFRRGWSWSTEGDALSLLATGKMMAGAKIIPQPVSWAQIKSVFERTAPLVKQAYDRLGEKPGLTEFQSVLSGDVRGLPSWEMRRWKDRT
ncbi:ABC-type nitrate/sulfonate/bicarbonate transport system, substrate-binding protein [Polaromonas sp. YR568]|uniref:ABC transporter substrate-binding protein n=1 Tax=Polaromonas sp. YR568 TaxID=1855301 RepID=UPI0008E3C4DD|nr:ABC transporter substrate-binding protein [Polaromonas sp. YR568]SFU66020.1 ABC-type nitrate/sulfonate/bicarbonate transport system, substrate-binding protein [Polaromonas sp. YR568]